MKPVSLSRKFSLSLAALVVAAASAVVSVHNIHTAPPALADHATEAVWSATLIVQDLSSEGEGVGCQTAAGVSNLQCANVTTLTSNKVNLREGQFELISIFIRDNNRFEIHMPSIFSSLRKRLINYALFVDDTKLLISDTETGTSGSELRWLNHGLSWSVGDSVEFNLRLDLKAGDLEPHFGIGGKVSTAFSSNASRINAMARQSDHKIVVAGWAAGDEGNDFALARYNQDGSLDTSFGTGGKITQDFSASSDEARALEILVDGSILVVGVSWDPFGMSNNIALAYFDSRGQPKRNFPGMEHRLTLDIGTNTDDQPYAIGFRGHPDEEDDSDITIAGRSGNSFFIVRYLLNGTLDTSFSSDGKRTYNIGTGRDEARSLAFSGNSTILAGSSVQAGTGTITHTDFALLKVGNAGAPDTDFGSNGRVLTGFTANANDGINAIILTEDATPKIWAAGYANDGTFDKFAVARYNINNGNLDTSFSSNGKHTYDFGENASDVANAIDIGLDGSVVVAGKANGTQFGVVDVGATGTIGRSFLSHIYGADEATAVKSTPGSDIIAAGYAKVGSHTDFAVVQYDWKTAGAEHAEYFGHGGVVITRFGAAIDSARDIDIGRDDEIIVAGQTNSAGTERIFIADYRPQDGHIDSDFDGDGHSLTSLGVNARGVKYVEGASEDLQYVAGVSDGGSAGKDFFLARFLATNGSLDSSFGSSGGVSTDFNMGDDEVFAIGVQSDKKIVLAGYVTDGSATKIGLARYTTAGALDTSFGTSGTITTSVGSGNSRGHAMAIMDNDKIVVAGSANNGNNDDFALVRFTAAGALDTASFGTGAGTTLTGKVTTSFAGNRDEVARAVAIQKNGKIVVAGQAYNGTDNDFALARYDRFGTLDTSFAGDGKKITDFNGTADSIAGIAIQADGKIVVAGFTTVSGEKRVALARYNPNGTLDTKYGSSGKVTTEFVGAINSEATAVTLLSNGDAVMTGFGTFSEAGPNSKNQDIVLARYLAEATISDDPSLSSLSLNSSTDGSSFSTSETISPTFDTEQTSYIASIARGSTHVNVTPTTTSSEASIRVSSSSGGAVSEFVPSGNTSGGYSVANGDRIRVRVTAGDGTTIRTYVVRIQVASGNADGSTSPSDIPTPEQFFTYIERSSNPVGTLSIAGTNVATPHYWSITNAAVDGSISAGDIADRNLFQISQDGVLSLKRPISYIRNSASYVSGTPASTDKQYRVTVQASDGHTTQYFKAFVEVVDVNLRGRVTLAISGTGDVSVSVPLPHAVTYQQFQPGATLEARVVDLDADRINNVVPREDVTWKWYRGSSLISDANDRSYKVVAGDVGRVISVEATYRVRKSYDEDSSDYLVLDSEETVTASAVRPVKATRPLSTKSVPSFGPDLTFNVPENTVGNFGHQVLAHHPDGDFLTYTVRGADAIIAYGVPRFEINNASGVLRVASGVVLDYEGDAKQSYELEVRAYDSSANNRGTDTNPQLIVDTTVTVNITDVDEKPEFDDGVPIGAIAAQTEGRTLIDLDNDTSDSRDVPTFVASDPEGGNVSLTLLGPDADLFELAADTDNTAAVSQVLSFKNNTSFNSPADANQDNIYEVTVRASDGELFSDRSVSIMVLGPFLDGLSVQGRSIIGSAVVWQAVPIGTFSPAKNTYRATVASPTDRVRIAPVASQGTTIQVNGTAVASGANRTLSLGSAGSSSNFKVRVTLSTGGRRVYDLTVKRLTTDAVNWQGKIVPRQLDPWSRGCRNGVNSVVIRIQGGHSSGECTHSDLLTPSNSFRDAVRGHNYSIHEISVKQRAVYHGEALFAVRLVFEGISKPPSGQHNNLIFFIKTTEGVREFDLKTATQTTVDGRFVFSWNLGQGDRLRDWSGGHQIGFKYNRTGISIRVHYDGFDDDGVPSRRFDRWTNARLKSSNPQIEGVEPSGFRATLPAEDTSVWTKRKVLITHAKVRVSSTHPGTSLELGRGTVGQLPTSFVPISSGELSEAIEVDAETGLAWMYIRATNRWGGKDRQVSIWRLRIDPPPRTYRITNSAVKVIEGQKARLRVSLSSPATATGVTLRVVPSFGSGGATADDVGRVVSTVVVPPGKRVATIVVPTVDDRVVEAANVGIESFEVSISHDGYPSWTQDPHGTATAVVSIRDDDGTVEDYHPNWQRDFGKDSDSDSDSDTDTDGDSGSGTGSGSGSGSGAGNGSGAGTGGGSGSGQPGGSSAQGGPPQQVSGDETDSSASDDSQPDDSSSSASLQSVLQAVQDYAAGKISMAELLAIIRAYLAS